MVIQVTKGIVSVKARTYIPSGYSIGPVTLMGCN